MEEENLVDQSAVSPEMVFTEKEPLNFWMGFLLALSVFGAQILCAIVAGLIALAIVGADMDKIMPLAMGITMIISFPVAAWFVLRFRKMASTAWVWKQSFWVLLIISFFMVFGTSWVVGVLMELLPNYDSMVEQYASMFENFNPILLFIGGAIIGPICEEIIFRGVILKEFLLKYEPKMAILFSAIIFSVIHMVPLQMIATFFVGIVLGYIYYKTKSLWLVSIIHIVNNAVAFSMGTDEMIGGETTREWFGNDLFFFGSVILVLAVVYGLYLLFERLHGSDAQSELVNQT